MPWFLQKQYEFMFHMQVYKMGLTSLLLDQEMLCVCHEDKEKKN